MPVYTLRLRRSFAPLRETLFVKLLRNSSSQRDNLLSSVFHPVSHCEAQTRFANNALAFFYVGAFEPNNDRNFHTQVLCSAHDSARNHVAADNTAENIDEHCAHMFVRQQNAKCGFHSFLRCPAADIQK